MFHERQRAGAEPASFLFTGFCLALSTCSSGQTINPPLRQNAFNACVFLMKHVKLIISLSPCCCCGRILNTTLFESWEIVGPYPSWWVFNLLLILLQLLHSFWSYLIVKTACRAISKGKVSHSSSFESLCIILPFIPVLAGCFAASTYKLTV